MFGITSTGLSILKSYQNDGKKARWNLDAWDRVCTLLSVIVRAHWLTCAQQSMWSWSRSYSPRERTKLTV